MANVKITNTNGTDLNGAILENAATEATLQELLRVMSDKKKSPLGELEKSSKKASDNLEEFSDTLDEVTVKNSKSMKALNFITNSTASTLNVFNRGLKSSAGISDDAQGQIEQLGGVVSGSASAAGDAISGLGDAMSGAGKKFNKFGIALEVAGAGMQMFATASGAAFGAMSTIIGLVQGFQQTFKAINSTGFILDSSFEQLSKQAFDANLTLGQFAGVVDRNRSEFVYFSGSVNQGAKRILALSTAVNTSGLSQSFINMGVSLENIPDVLTNYMSLVGRSGRQMQQSDQQAIAGATALYKQQRLLANLTGKSVEALQAESMERTRATRVQASLNEMGPEARLAFDQAAGIAGMLGDTFKTGFEAIFAGDVTDPIYQAMMGGAPTITRAFEDIRNRIATGEITMEDAQKEMYTAIQRAGPGLEAELNQVAETLRYSGIDTSLSALGPDLGVALERIPTIIANNLDTTQKLIEQQFAGGTDGKGAADPMLESFRNVEAGALTVKIALQDVATQITTNIGDEATGIFKQFADGLKIATDELLATASTLGGSKSWYDVDLTEAAGASFTTAGAGAALGSAAGGIGALPGAIAGGLIGFVGDVSAQIIGNLLGYANGGISSGPTSGYLTELHGTEAVVPLPDGRSIPVQMTSAESKSMPELVQINKNLLQQNFSLNEKLDRLIRVTEESNNISRNTAYSRA